MLYHTPCSAAYPLYARSIPGYIPQVDFCAHCPSGSDYTPGYMSSCMPGYRPAYIFNYIVVRFETPSVGRLHTRLPAYHSDAWLHTWFHTRYILVRYPVTSVCDQSLVTNPLKEIELYELHHQSHLCPIHRHTVSFSECVVDSVACPIGLCLA